MRLFLLLFCLLFVCSCAGGSLQGKVPEKIVKKEEVVLLAPVETEKVETEKVEPEKVVTFTSIINKEGIPFDNIIPRSKEQVAIYKNNDHFSFYYFKNNKLSSKKKYSLQEVDKIKAENKYPKKILKDLGAI